MLLKELKYRIFSVAFIIILIAVPFMVYYAMSKDRFKEWFFYAEPLDFSRYSYIRLNEYYEDGSIHIHYINPELRRIVVENRSLNEEMRSELKEFILRMSPDFTMKDELKNLKVMVEDEEIIDFINRLEYKFKGSMGISYNDGENKVIIGAGLRGLIAEGTCLEYEYRDYIARRIFSYHDGDLISAETKPSDLEMMLNF